MFKLVCVIFYFKKYKKEVGLLAISEEIKNLARKIFDKKKEKLDTESLENNKTSKLQARRSEFSELKIRLDEMLENAVNTRNKEEKDFLTEVNKVLNMKIVRTEAKLGKIKNLKAFKEAKITKPIKPERLKKAGIKPIA